MKKAPEDMDILNDETVQDTVVPENEKWNLFNTLTREEYENLFHLRGRRKIFTAYDGTDVHVGDWVYVDSPAPKNRNESEPDIIEGFYRSYYKEVFVVVRLGSLGKNLGRRRTYSLRSFKHHLRLGKIELLQMPKFRYGDRFKNKFNKEEVVIRDVPRSLNEKENEFVYYVRTYSYKEGYNYRSMLESEITEFFHTDGVVKR